MQNKPKIEATLNVPQQGHPDPEGRMAKSELYRAAKMSMKLFQMIQDGQQLEAWVQAKITKSADYLDSIYHYMEYQAKFGAGASAATVDDITNDLPTQVDEPEEAVEIDESWTYEEKLNALLEAKVKKKMERWDPEQFGSDGSGAGGAGAGDISKSDKKKKSAAKDVEESSNRKVPKGLTYSGGQVKKRPELVAAAQREKNRKAAEKRKADKEKAKEPVEEAIDTVEKDAQGNVKSWKHEGDWKKSDKKDPRGKVTHASDVARRKTEKMGKK